MTQAERIRNYYRDNPSAKAKAVAEALAIEYNSVKANVHKDVKAGRCVRMSDGSLDYSAYFKVSEEVGNLREWQNEVRRELIEQLLEANRHETASDQIRLNAKEINKLLNEVTRL
ncbi:TPA: hypothetical protein U2D00_000727 [Streptococcus suis]|uniref:hypothetical protein n=1 Tax=Streptococcus suis TaxID=1307 RepID=UPI000427D5A8|nr:hypothetical protein [Streptococcus suis]MDY7593854.1 hypothetical protein [Streptococcus suis]NQQ29861.1 hypothetical protein [Streptococcus suis]HEL1613977.1 hypothetical protein [Streptococcus suis]HEL2254784.1 hypothetical protein [Streptococcus suis]HEL2407282.1 hypothetical protein [Streptococcus suis]